MAIIITINAFNGHNKDHKYPFSAHKQGDILYDKAQIFNRN